VYKCSCPSFVLSSRKVVLTLKFLKYSAEDLRQGLPGIEGGRMLFYSTVHIVPYSRNSAQLFSCPSNPLCIRQRTALSCHRLLVSVRTITCLQHLGTSVFPPQYSQSIYRQCDIYLRIVLVDRRCLRYQKHVIIRMHR
jgi:hypothetical protein